MKAIGVKMVDIMPMFALEKAKDAIWNGLGFVLQWAKDGIKRG